MTRPPGPNTNPPCSVLTVKPVRLKDPLSRVTVPGCDMGGYVVWFRRVCTCVLFTFLVSPTGHPGGIGCQQGRGTGEGEASPERYSVQAIGMHMLALECIP